MTGRVETAFPRTRSDILRSAVRCAIRHGCERSKINVAAWAATYGVTMKAVRDCWSEELTKVEPSFESGGEGK